MKSPNTRDCPARVSLNDRQPLGKWLPQSPHRRRNGPYLTHAQNGNCTTSAQAPTPPAVRAVGTTLSTVALPPVDQPLAIFMEQIRQAVSLLREADRFQGQTDQEELSRLRAQVREFMAERDEDRRGNGLVLAELELAHQATIEARANEVGRLLQKGEELEGALNKVSAEREAEREQVEQLRNDHRVAMTRASTAEQSCRSGAELTKNRKCGMLEEEIRRITEQKESEFKKKTKYSRHSRARSGTPCGLISRMSKSRELCQAATRNANNSCTDCKRFAKI